MSSDFSSAIYVEAEKTNFEKIENRSFFHMERKCLSLFCEVQRFSQNAR